MKCAADFRQIAREALRGKWVLAVFAGVLVWMANGPSAGVNSGGSGVRIEVSYLNRDIVSQQLRLDSGLTGLLFGGVLGVIALALVLGLLFLVIRSVINVGYAQFNMELVDGGTPTLNTLLAHKSNWKTIAWSDFLRGLYVALWSLLFIIPGIVATYSYAMTDYILAEYPDLTAGEAIARSKAMMDGNRWRLFCLDFSFIGWAILCMFTLGIGNLFLRPYEDAAKAAFYRDLCQSQF